jgi:hypothetical protein
MSVKHGYYIFHKQKEKKYVLQAKYKKILCMYGRGINKENGQQSTKLFMDLY